MNGRVRAMNRLQIPNQAPSNGSQPVSASPFSPELLVANIDYRSGEIMKTTIQSCQVLLFALLTTTFTLVGQAQAQGASPIQGVLDQNLVTVGSGGKEVLTPAERVKPGDLLEYRVRYSNKGNSTVNDFAVTLPIPKGLELVAQSDSPRAALASTDGSKFEPVPLLRKVKKSDGSEATEPVPLAEYRALRWQLGQLGAGKTAQFAARAKVEAANVAAAR